MPAGKLTPKRAAFARYVAAIGYDDAITSQSDAYKLAYPRARNWKPEAVRSEASRLMAVPIVAAEVTRLLAERAKRHEITVDGIAEELHMAAEGARKAGQHGAEVQAVMGKAKLGGLLVDKREEVRPNTSNEDYARQEAKGLFRADKDAEAKIMRLFNGEIEGLKIVEVPFPPKLRVVK